MATRTIANGGGNFSANATWVEGVAPTSADDVVATGTSGQLTIDTTTCACKTMILTGYTNTMTFTAAKILTVSGTVTFVSGMTIAGTGTLVVNATATLTSAGNTMSGDLTFTGAATFTLGDNWVVTGTVTFQTGAVVLNSNQLTCNGSMTNTISVSGTTAIVLGGTGTVSSTGAVTTTFGNNLTINTSGTITFLNGGSFNYGLNGTSPTLTYTAGTVVSTNCIFRLTGDATLLTSGMTWQSFRHGGVALTMTLNQDFNANLFADFSQTSLTITGSYTNINVSSFIINPSNGAPTVSVKSGTNLNITSKISLVCINDAAFNTFTIKSGTATSSFNFNFTGSLSSLMITGITFTDVDASGSTNPIPNYFGNTLTRTTNINNITLPVTYGATFCCG